MKGATLALALIALAAGARAETLRIEPTGPAETVFDKTRDACERWDVPDTGARAFRDASGQVVLFASHYTSRALTGPDLDHLKHDCAVRFQGGDRADPSAYDDRAWLSGLATEDGKTVHALVHNEFQGQRHPGVCPMGDYVKCWRNAITYAVSHDGGKTFVQPKAHFIAALPYRYDPQAGRNTGYFNPTNIVKKEGWYYSLFGAAEYKAQKYGVCLMRTRTPGVPSSWRAWDGTDFTVRFADPYCEKVGDPARHVCSPVPGGKFPTNVWSLNRHAPSGMFVLLFTHAQGIYASTSRDLIHWSDGALVLPTPTQPAPGNMPGSCAYYDRYASLLNADPAAPRPEVLDNRAYLYFTRVRLKDCKDTDRRDLLRVPVTISAQKER